MNNTGVPTDDGSKIDINGLEITKEMLINLCLTDFNKNLHDYKKMYEYYCGDTDAMKHYKMQTKRSNQKTKCNFIKKFIKDEVSYVLGNKITYVSRSSDANIVNDITLNTAHWLEKHDQHLLKSSLIFGESYELYYINNDGLFSAIVLTPLNGYVLVDDYGNIQLALHIFQKKFNMTRYVDVYFPDRIEHYTGASPGLTMISEDPNYFGEIPFSICPIAYEKSYDTLFNDIKGLQDAFETNLSDISNEISDFRNAYLKVLGAKLEDKDLIKMKELGIMQVPKDGDVDWLIKNINDAFIQNTLKSLEEKMFQLSGHINTNEKITSNTSSLALRARLISLENKCSLNGSALVDCLKRRLKFLFIYLKIKQSKTYDYRDIKPKFTPNIPQDDLMTAQVISQLGDKLSTETGLAQLSFIDNVAEELKKIREQNKANSIGDSLLNPPPVVTK